jgi:hypothetical protein
MKMSLDRTRTAIAFGSVLAAALSGAAAGAADARVNLLQDATNVPVALRKAITGPVMVYKLTLSEVSVEVDVQDSVKKENIDRYEYDNGGFGKPRPVTMRGRYTQKDLDAAVFPLESIDFSLVPKMIADARQLLAMPDGKTTTLFLESGRPHKKPFWHVGVTDARHHGAVTYDLKGRKLSTFKK